MMNQSSRFILMIRPANFGFNEETAESNAFQRREEALEDSEIQTRALAEFDEFVHRLIENEIDVTVVDDSEYPVKTDAVFPNNWISFHQDGSVITYPMYSESRRTERREDVIQEVAKKFEVSRRYSFEQYEEEGKFLEGTGSMVLDHINSIAYACLSCRTSIEILEKFCVLKNYDKVVFHAYDRSDREIYHTNVMMTLGTDLAVVCLASVKDRQERANLADSLLQNGKEILEISVEQMESFAGNMLEVQNLVGQKFMVMSEAAYLSLASDQLSRIESRMPIISSPIPTIEKLGGGSVRCMMAEIFLKYRPRI